MSLLDWFVIVVYLGGVVAAGLWFGRKEEDMEDYFLGGRQIPWVAALLSMVATEISAATFLGAPEQGYVRDLTYLQFGIGSILARFALAFLFMGLFYRLRLYTVYGYLSHRFGFPTKNACAGTFLLGRFFAGGSRLFIASLAVKVVTGMDLAWAIVLLGAISIAYTLFGGIKAVIWTDVIQALVLAGGACISILFLLDDIPLSFPEILASLREAHKFRLLDTAWRDGAGNLRLFSNAFHFLPAILGGFFLTMATHGTDQAMIQRLLTCKDSFRGKLSMVMSGFLGIGVTCLFLAVGMLLFVYASNLSEGDPMLGIASELEASGRNGNFFLYYIIHSLPAGVSGIIIASVVAAAMSSIDSELNAMSATFTNDFYLPYFNPKASNRQAMRVARLSTMVCGIFLIAVGVLIADFYRKNPQTDLLSIALGVMTLFYGGLLGIFLLGVLTRTRGNNATNISGLAVSTLLIIFISYKAKILPGLGLVDPMAPGDGFWAWAYEAQLAWPWFIVLGTGLTFAIAILGMTARAVLGLEEKTALGRDS